MHETSMAHLGLFSPFLWKLKLYKSPLFLFLICYMDQHLRKFCKQYIRVAGYQKGHQVKIWILSNNIIFIIMGLWIFKGQLKVMLFILHMTFNFYSVSCIVYLWSLISCFCCFLKSTSDVKQILTKGRCRNKSMGVWSQDSVWMRGIISVLPATEWIYRAGILSYYALCYYSTW